MNPNLPKKKNLSIMTILNLVRESKKNGICESDVWKTFLKHRWDINILKTNSCLIEDQKADVIFKTAKDLRIHYDSNNWIPEEDLKLATELFSAITYCPKNLIESAKLSKLFESLLTNENLNTVVAASMHNIQPRAGDNIKYFAAINMWYQRLDERYNFSLGPKVLPLMTTDSLTELEAFDPPFLQNGMSIMDQQNVMPKHIGELVIFQLLST